MDLINRFSNKVVGLYKECLVVDKVWGKEIVIRNDQSYCHKKLVLNKGHVCSKHSHKVKMETFTIESGKVRMEHNDRVLDMNPGESITIFPKEFHRFSGMENSVISEVSTLHSDDDVVRLEDSFLSPILICFDVDGTLIASDGIISKEHIGNLDFGIISSRSRKRSRDVCDRMDISPTIGIYNCRVVSRAEEMRYVDRVFPIRQTVYVGDMISDKTEAERAGWIFLSPQEFVALREGKCLNNKSCM